VLQAKRKNNGRVPYRYTAKLLKKKVEKHFLRCP
jgi:hypothetical protein